MLVLVLVLVPMLMLVLAQVLVPSLIRVSVAPAIAPPRKSWRDVSPASCRYRTDNR